MSAPLTSPQGGAGITANLIGTVGAATTTTNVQHIINRPYTVGSAAGNVQYCYTNVISVTSGTPQVLDLTTLTDPQGNALAFNAWTEILIENQSTTAGQDVSVGGGTNPIFTSEGEPLYAPNGYMKICNPNGQTVDSTHKTLQLTVAAGTSVPVKVTILGR